MYGLARVVIGENKNFLGGEAYLRSRGVEVVVLDDAECTALMDKFIAEKPDLWYVSFTFLVVLACFINWEVSPLPLLPVLRCLIFWSYRLQRGDVWLI